MKIQTMGGLSPNWEVLLALLAQGSKALFDFPCQRVEVLTAAHGTLQLWPFDSSQ